jgi:hypothetical protein
LPTQGQPADFSGAVGNFEINSTLPGTDPARGELGVRAISWSRTHVRRGHRRLRPGVDGAAGHERDSRMADFP